MRLKLIKIFKVMYLTPLLHKPRHKRVIEEKAQIDIKLNSIRNFMYENPIYMELSEDYQREEFVLARHSGILEKRINSFNS